MKTPDGWQDYVCTYRLDDAEYGIAIRATDMEDARRRLRAIGYNGRVEGELKMIIPVPGLLARLLAWWRR